MPTRQSAKKGNKGTAGRKSDNNAKSPCMSQIKEEDETKKPDDVDDDFNSGFGSYMKSSEGIDMLKLFVMANSLVLLLTVAWPAMKETLYIVRDYFLK